MVNALLVFAGWFLADLGQAGGSAPEPPLTCFSVWAKIIMGSESWCCFFSKTVPQGRTFQMDRVNICPSWVIFVFSEKKKDTKKEEKNVTENDHLKSSK